ncbi:uncharacterized protein PV07_05495 [Cladophialophora immunda]|uniref:Uncharacterized protein n=1 Tax=Cladophialophora immunda TaxID=569365 RepID=A0A0D2CF18_9EURO|nr:uncharacterized protein PV07_05495 [Cladophialophora immunda]KIW29703.1 hypothetical protein PV07_05495 [Cladophialophora immunda]
MDDEIKNIEPLAQETYWRPCQQQFPPPATPKKPSSKGKAAAGAGAEEVNRSVWETEVGDEVTLADGKIGKAVGSFESKPIRPVGNKPLEDDDAQQDMASFSIEGMFRNDSYKPRKAKESASKIKPPTQRTSERFYETPEPRSSAADRESPRQGGKASTSR